MAEETKTITCKYCGSEGVVKYGSYKGVQRYFARYVGANSKAMIPHSILRYHQSLSVVHWSYITRVRVLMIYARTSETPKVIIHQSR